MGMSPETNGNEQSLQASKLHLRNPQGKDITDSLFLDHRHEVFKEETNRQLCLHTLNLR